MHSAQQSRRFGSVESLESRHLLSATTIGFNDRDITILGGTDDEVIVKATRDTAIYPSDSQLYVTDGTEAGTTALLPESRQDIRYLGKVGQGLLLHAGRFPSWMFTEDPVLEPGIWISRKGDSAPELLISRHGPRQFSIQNVDVHRIADVDYILLQESRYTWSAAERESVREYRSQLWRTDGTPAGTYIIKTATGHTKWLGQAGSRVFWALGQASVGEEVVALYAIDPDFDSTELLINKRGTIVTECESGRSPRCLAVIGSNQSFVFFSLESVPNSPSRHELWIINEMTQGTQRFTQARVNQMAVTDTFAYFSGTGPDSNDGLWRVDVTGRFVRVAVSSPHARLRPVGDDVAFERTWTGRASVTITCDTCGQVRLSQWMITQGEEAAAELGPVNLSRNAYAPMLHDGHLVFRAREDEAYGMWVTDGTGSDLRKFGRHRRPSLGHALEVNQSPRGLFYWVANESGSAASRSHDVWRARPDFSGSDTVATNVTSDPWFIGTKMLYTSPNGLEVVDFRAQNPATRHDVDADGVVGPLDALLVISELSLREMSTPDGLVLPELRSADRFQDVDGDGYVGPLDALIVINELPYTSSVSAIVTRESIEETKAAVPKFAEGLTEDGLDSVINADRTWTYAVERDSPRSNRDVRDDESETAADTIFERWPGPVTDDFRPSV